MVWLVSNDDESAYRKYVENLRVALSQEPHTEHQKKRKSSH